MNLDKINQPSSECDEDVHLKISERVKPTVRCRCYIFCTDSAEFCNDALTSVI